MRQQKTGLTFDELRRANTARLPEFKNKHGKPAHSTKDGSDWSPAKWLRAVMGELGELAQVRIQYEEGKITRAEYELKAAKELADVQTYLDILGLRLLDQTQNYPFDYSAAQTFMHLVCDVGTYANEAKKFDRGDISESDIKGHTADLVHCLTRTSRELQISATMKDHPADEVLMAHPTGVSLGDATLTKFNEVTRRVGSNVFIDRQGVVIAQDDNERQRLNYESDPSTLHPCYD